MPAMHHQISVLCKGKCLCLLSIWSTPLWQLAVHQMHVSSSLWTAAARFAKWQCSCGSSQARQNEGHGFAILALPALARANTGAVTMTTRDWLAHLIARAGPGIGAATATNLAFHLLEAELQAQAAFPLFIHACCQLAHLALQRHVLHPPHLCLHAKKQLDRRPCMCKPSRRSRRRLHGEHLWLELSRQPCVELAHVTLQQCVLRLPHLRLQAWWQNMRGGCLGAAARHREGLAALKARASIYLHPMHLRSGRTEFIYVHRPQGGRPPS